MLLYMILTNKESITLKRIAMTQIVIISWGDRKIVYQLLNYLFYLIFPYKSVWLSIRSDSHPPLHDFHPKRLSFHLFPFSCTGTHNFHAKPSTSRGNRMLLYVTFSKTIFFIFRPSLIYYQHSSRKMSKFGKDLILHNYQKKIYKI